MNEVDLIKAIFYGIVCGLIISGIMFLSRGLMDLYEVKQVKGCECGQMEYE